LNLKALFIAAFILHPKKIQIMNPAFRTRALAVLLSAGAILCLARADHGILLISLTALLASLGSLLGFYLLFELLSRLDISKRPVWIYAILGASSIVAFHAVCLLLFIGDAASRRFIWEVYGVLPLTLLPMAAAIIGAALSYRNADACCGPDRDAYYPDACI
jgi:hypothetical protein